jgi:signal transduction histidine kinase
MPNDRLAEIQSGRSGVGIRGMHERVRQFGGTLAIESNGNGTRILATIPIDSTKDKTTSEQIRARA